MNRLITFASSRCCSCRPSHSRSPDRRGLHPRPFEGTVWLPTLFGVLAVLAFGILLDTLTFRRTGHSLLRSQRNYLLWSGVAGAVTGTLLAYLNLFAESWFTAGSETQALLLAAISGAALLPAILISRLWLAGLPGLVRLSTRRFALPALPPETAAILLLLARTDRTARRHDLDQTAWAGCSGYPRCCCSPRCNCCGMRAPSSPAWRRATGAAYCWAQSPASWSAVSRWRYIVSAAARSISQRAPGN